MTGFALKLIAIAAMLADHSGVMLGDYLSQDVYEAMRSVGRIAFPIFVFLLTEGCRHTSNMKRYLVRLGLFALISEVPFDFLFANVGSRGGTVFLEFGYQNVFFTLFLGALAVFWYQRMMKENPAAFGNLLNLAALGAIIAAGGLLRSDYGPVGVAAIFFCYAARDKRRQALLLSAVFLLFYLSDSTADGPMYSLKMICGTAVSIVCVLLYNGKRGRPLKWAFYAFYPAHLAALGLIYHYFLSLGPPAA